MNTKNNVRYEATDKKICEYFLNELNNTDIKNIHVTDICKRIGINRSSFYAHYMDVYEILEKLSAIVGVSLRQELENAHITEDHIGTRESLIVILDHIKENRRFYSAYFSHVDPKKIDKHLDSLFNTDISPFLEKRGVSSIAEQHYFYSFFRAGLIEVIKEWIKRDCVESSETMANITMRI